MNNHDNKHNHHNYNHDRTYKKIINSRFGNVHIYKSKRKYKLLPATLKKIMLLSSTKPYFQLIKKFQMDYMSTFIQ